MQAVHDKIKNYVCKECGHATAQKNNLDSHIKRMHGIGLETEDAHKCPTCPRKFSNSRALRLHITSRVHEKLKDFKCPTCDFSTATNHDLIRHMKSAHLNGGSEVHKM